MIRMSAQKSLRSKYMDYDLADSITDLMAAGWSEQDAAREMIGVYEQSFVRGESRDRPWTRRAADIIVIGGE